MQKNDNHYVPQFYLREFLDKQCEPPHQPSLWVFDKTTGQQKKRGVSNVGFEKGLYNLKLVDGSISHIVEDFFNHEIETPASKIYRKILSMTAIEDAERFVFSQFLYFTLARTPNYLNYMSWFYKNGKDMYSNYPEVDLTFSNELINSAGISGDKETLEFMIEMSKIFSPIIYNMNWQFLSAPVGKVFVTSDNPLILNDPSNKEPMPTFLGWNNPNIQLTFPLSSTMCMKATWGRRKKLFIKSDMTFWRAVNFRTSFFANRFVFSSQPIEKLPINCTFLYNRVDTYKPYK